MIRRAELFLSTIEGRLIYRILWRGRVWAAMVVAFLFNCGCALGASWIGWKGWSWEVVAVGTIGMAIYCMLPSDPFAVGDLNVNGLRLGEKFVPAAELERLEYREGGGRGLYAGGICIGPELGREDAMALERSIRLVIPVRED